MWLQVEGLPVLFSDMGVGSLRYRSPSPMASRAIDLIAELALAVNADLSGP